MKLGQLVREVNANDWVIPRFTAYWQGKRDLDAEAEIATRLLSAPQRDRTKSWSASSAGYCPRSAQLQYLGMKQEVPANLQLIFTHGDFVHLKHQIAGMVAGYLTDVEVPVTMDSHNVRGTMDGMSSEPSGVEFKSISSYGFSEVAVYGPKTEHLDQVMTYMWCFPDIPFFRIVYENKNDQKLKEFVVQRDPAHIARLEEHFERLNDYVEHDQLIKPYKECLARSSKQQSCLYGETCLRLAEK